MARKSLADRIREQGTVTQKELDKSKGIAKNITNFPKKNLHQNSSVVTDINTDNNSDNITDIVSDNPSNKVSNSVSKSVTKCHSNGHSPCHRNSKSLNLSVTKSVTNITEPFDVDLSELGIHLTNRQLKVYNFLKSHGTNSFIQATYISQILDIPISTVRNILKNLKTKDILTYSSVISSISR